VARYLSFVKLARNRFRWPEDYQEFQPFQADQLIGAALAKEVLHMKLVLDLGSGNGGYAMELAKHARVVYVLDLNISTHFPHNRTMKSPSMVMPGAYPLQMARSVSVAAPALSNISQIRRRCRREYMKSLSPKSLCYLSFPPFYSLVGEHQFTPFHYLPEKICLNLCKRVKKIECSS